MTDLHSPSSKPPLPPAYANIQLFFLNCKHLEGLTALPIYCHDVQTILTPLEEINHDNALIVFISHRGVAFDDADTTLARPQPDSAQNDKFKLLVEAIEKIMTGISPGMEECYIWMDCICRSISDLALSPYDRIFECIDLMLTPLHDPSVTDIPQSKPYDAKPWGYGPEAYLNRMWCRLEMMISTATPMKRYDEIRRAKMSPAFLLIIDKGFRPHLLYGSFESKQNLPPLVLPEKSPDFFDTFSPFSGNVSIASDMHMIKQYLEQFRSKVIAEQILEV